MDSHSLGDLLLKIIVIILSARIAGILCEKIGQSAVLGELIVGIILGPSVLNFIGVPFSEVIVFLAEFGIIILLFEVGLESNIYKLMKVGVPSLFVAITGVILPITFGFIYCYITGYNVITSLFLGGTLAATSVGITSRILSEMGKVDTKEGKVILGAAVIDDILGLIVLSVLVGIAATGEISFFEIGKLTLTSVFFLIGSLFIGIKLAPYILKLMEILRVSKIITVLSVLFALGLSLIADKLGLATIVGAFAAGLILETTESKENITERIKPLSELFVPIFFVYSGLMVDIKTFLSLNALIPIGILLFIAVITKILAGWTSFGIKAKKYVIGIGMIPRGEVGLIFASIGLTNKIFDSELYSIIVSVVILTTFIAPPLLSWALKKIPEENVIS